VERHGFDSFGGSWQEPKKLPSALPLGLTGDKPGAKVAAAVSFAPYVRQESRQSSVRIHLCCPSVGTEWNQPNHTATNDYP
jgi:hypothetical protein